VIFDTADLAALRDAVSGGKSVLVSTHIHPDPDAIGSVLAVREILQQLGAAPRVILNDPVPVRCRILPGANEVSVFPRDAIAEKFHVAVIVDSGSRSRIGDVENLLDPDAFIVNLDHHVSNDRFGAVNLIDLESSATGELLFFLCHQLGLKITPSIAHNLFAGVLTDTGRFRYPSTTSRTLSVASELIAAGADTTGLTNALYYDLPAGDVKSLGAIYSTLELFEGDQIPTLFCRLEYLVEDPDTVVDTALSIRGVQIAALLSETPEGKIRVSLRSKNEVNVSLIAAGFGGGGHQKAAGFRMRGTLESVRERLLPVLVDALAAVAPQTAVEDV
jgi:bifunctional oligoribonuclease and PAP phosphatase NrnA